MASKKTADKATAPAANVAPAAKKTPAVKAAAPAAKVAANRVNSFATTKFEDHTIVDADNKVVGHVRVKPNNILWSPKNGKDWYGVPLSEFSAFLEKNGKKQKK